jgi:carbonic anhydrase
VAHTEDMLAANDAFAATFDKGDAQLPPNKPVAIATCIDARVHPERFLGFEIGDAHVSGTRADEPATTPFGS